MRCSVQASRKQIEKASASESVKADPRPSAFAKTQDELASRLGITRKTIGNCLRKFKSAKPPVPATRADGRYDVAAWAGFLHAHNIARKAEEVPAGDADPETGIGTVVEWKQEKLKLECERLRIEIEKTAGELVEVADMEARLGIMLAAFRTAANNLPGRTAQKLVGLKDYHEIEEILSAEVAVMLRTLEACPFLADEPAAAPAEESPAPAEPPPAKPAKPKAKAAKKARKPPAP